MELPAPLARRSSTAHRVAERITLAVSVLLLAAVVGGLVLVELRGGDARPRVDVDPHFARAYRHDGQWYLPVSVRNVGDITTDVLRVALVRAVPGTDADEVSELEFAFVAGGERVAGIAVFDERPTKDDVTVDVVSITEP